MSNKKKGIILCILFFVLIIVFLVSIKVGAVKYSFKEIIYYITHNTKDNNRAIIYNVRLPRVLLSMLVGITLALAGIILQGVMRNSMASASTIGVTSGANFAGYLFLVALPMYSSFLTISTFVGGFVTTLLIYLLAYKNGSSPIKIILAGMGVTALLNAFADLIKVFFPENLAGATSFLVGGLTGVTWQSFFTVLPYAIIGIFLVIFIPTKMNILALGDETAQGLGLNTNRFRLFLIVLASLLASSTVSVVGLIGFIGIVVPHIARILVGNDHKYLFPATILLGAIIVSICDTIGRVIILPAELPVSIIMAVLGAPVFLLLLRGKKEVTDVA
ncbi:FecCD family ABC transporter permease [Haploplasma axanthum]|uniref:Probable siderophore transport system permease protein yfhA n=1 Tax=Haploplasma axanthum TaxID=29552 RepID=A0A449BFH8_HAPAX|nr:iron ABC transporter permease [Haploplasma axanthum]VEU81191.1 Probable siderophore transport system permease protein yfhA [Haploplasma axanthum]